MKTTKFQDVPSLYGQPCNCRPGIERDNCPACEGTGRRIDFAAIRARNRGASGQDRENYTDTQDRKFYVPSN